jgi:hypothetical protein
MVKLTVFLNRFKTRGSFEWYAKFCSYFKEGTTHQLDRSFRKNIFTYSVSQLKVCEQNIGLFDSKKVAYVDGISS